MNIARRQKFLNSGRTITRTTTRVDINFDLVTLDLMCSYVMSTNRNIRRSQYINMRNLFEILDLSLYQNDVEKMKRLDFIRKGLEARINKNLQDPKLILKYIKGGILDDDKVVDIDIFGNITNEELEWLNGTISTSLKYAFIYPQADRAIDLFTRFKACDYKAKEEIVSEIEQFINDMQTSFRKAKSQTVTDMTFTLKDGLFQETIQDVYDIISNPNRKLQCGMQGLNELVGGGFESGRVYGIAGVTGVGKSVTLLNLAVQLKKYNKCFVSKDPSKIPTIVYLTMENDVIETVRRLFNIATVSDDMVNFSVDQIIQMLRTEGELFLTEDSPINIIIKYVPNRSVDTGYLYTMVEDLEDEGYETICLIQDHLKRIRSCYPQSDIRIELGEVVNEFKTFAQLKQIPVITNTHLNREAAKVVEEMKRNKKQDSGKMLGKANVGESMLILDNIDYFFIINVDYDTQGHKYMAFSSAKIRDRSSDREYICQPFVVGNDIKFVEDFYSEVPAFKETLKEQPMLNNSFENRSSIRSSVRNNVNEVSEITDLLQFRQDKNIFSGHIYNSETVYIDEENEDETELVMGLDFGNII